MPYDKDELLREKIDQMNQPDRVDRFLDLISQIESSGGKDLSHPEMESGIHAGTAAMGRYGLMPNTVKEIATRAERAGEITPTMRELASMEDPTEMRQTVEQNPEIEQEYARQLAERVLSRFPNEEQAAFSWNQGHNLTPERVQKQQYKKHPYVEKFRRLKKSLVGK
jgi:hypothetical protein